MRTLLILALVVACGAKTNPTPVGTSPSPSGAGAGQSCGTRGAAACPGGEFCSYAPGDDCGATDKPGTCTAKPTMCPRIVSPVCGCDGKTYNNGCEAQLAMTGVRDNGACK
jgi:Kazal-type serine protease inhibitor-like protein